MACCCDKYNHAVFGKTVGESGKFDLEKPVSAWSVTHNNTLCGSLEKKQDERDADDGWKPGS